MVIAAPVTRAHLSIRWPWLPADLPLPDDPVDDEDHPLLAADSDATGKVIGLSAIAGR